MNGPVFLSYSRHDRSYVEELAAHLQAAGVATWWDYLISPGARFPREVQNRIDECAAFVVVLTPTAVASDWVQDELHYALEQRKTVVPLLLEPCRRPLRIVSIQHEDVTGGRMPSDAFIRRLHSRSTTRGNARAPATATPVRSSGGMADDVPTSSPRRTKQRSTSGAGPVFYLSYARSISSHGAVDPNGDVKQLFADLSYRLRQLLPLEPSTEVGFMDTNLEGGDSWTEELLRNLGTAQVFIALLSDAYLHRSEWCSMEWDFFSRRRVTRRSGSKLSERSAILPVLWTPIKTPLPSAMTDAQHFSPSSLAPPQSTRIYEGEGFLGVSDIDPGAYRTLIWSLARKVQDMVSSLSVDQPHEINIEDLRRSFDLDF